jgi:hypothetical protein
MKTRTSPHVRRCSGLIGLLAFGASVISTGLSCAQQINLADTSVFGGVINNALYLVDTTQPSGTGIFARDSRGVFLSVQANGLEEGYNSEAHNIMDTKRVDQWNHAVSFGDLSIVQINGIAYVPFLLDINEVMGGGRNLLSLDDVKIFTSSDSQLADRSLEALLLNPDNTLRYSLDNGSNDPSSWVLLDYGRSSSGSGRADMGLFVPLAAFAGTNLTDSVYLYCRFGGDVAGAGADATADAGFEEWTLGAGSAIPEPSAAVMVALASLAACLRRRRA